MKFSILFTNQRRARWLWFGLLGYLAVGAGLLARHFSGVFGLVMGLPLMLWAALVFYDKLFRQLGWVLVSAEGITWASPAAELPINLQFEELRTYRFELYRNGIKLFLYLQDGQKITLDARYSQEYGAMQTAFEQAVRRYNRAHASAALAVEKTFFERPISSKLLLGLLAAGAAWIAWSIRQQAAGIAYFPVMLVLLPYLAVWAGYSGRRE